MVFKKEKVYCEANNLCEEILYVQKYVCVLLTEMGYIADSVACNKMTQHLYYTVVNKVYFRK